MAHSMFTNLALLYVLQICKAGVARMRKIWFSRHGESEYNMFAKIGGDSNISPQGQIYAKLLPDLLVDRVPLVCTLFLSGKNSPLHAQFFADQT